MKQGTSHILLPLLAALLLPAGAAVAASPTSPTGRWLAEDIRGGGVIDCLQSVLEIAGDGRISGTGGCNRIMGKARIAGATITLSPLATTRMACSPAVMDQERKFLAALEAARSWRIDPARHKLVLLGARRRDARRARADVAAPSARADPNHVILRCERSEPRRMLKQGRASLRASVEARASPGHLRMTWFDPDGDPQPALPARAPPATPSPAAPDSWYNSLPLG